MIPDSLLQKLALMVGPEHVIASGDDLAAYATDGTKLVYPPDAVVFPGDASEVSGILKMATEEGFPVVPRGAGTGMSGGALPVRRGIILAMNRFDRIIDIDAENQVAKVEPGVITARLQDAVEEIGLFYPPDPASREISTIGGNVAECAGGMRAVKYGVTKDYVLGLTVVLPTGEILRTGVETMKGVAGYDLTRLITGSEGTLAVITSVVLKLIPRPEYRETMLVFFTDVASAVATVSRIIAQRITPSSIELMDRLCIGVVADEIRYRIPPGAGAMLLVEVDGAEGSVRREADLIRRVCERSGALACENTAPGESMERLWEARRKLSPSLYKLGPHKISEDVVVPRNRMADLMTHLEGLSLVYGLPTPSFGHAGDGNIHVNVLLDKADGDQLRRAHGIVQEVFRKVISLGGTITGEHGVGITKAPYLGMEISREGIQLMQRIKRAFDPRGILNPGKIFG